MRPKVSVAMATYNGDKFIKEQINSILVNLNEDDEIIISDDGSTDNTITVIKSINDKRIKIVQGPKKGVKQNFTNAIQNTTGDIIFLADQDDIWSKDKVKKVLKAFEDDIYTLVIHDCQIVDKNLNIINESFFKYRKSGVGVYKNIIKNTYIGCCMAFRRQLLQYIIPIPNNIYMHDQWIGLISELYGKNVFLKEKLIKYRRHGNNTDQLKHKPTTVMIKNRINLIKELLKNRRKNSGHNHSGGTSI